MKSSKKKVVKDKENVVRLDFGYTLPKIEITTNGNDVEGMIPLLKRIKSELLEEFLPSKEGKNIIVG